ncbi:oxidoreductase-like protein [Tricladium varicosporioides]|nr:oxidoreductase-like protein [Hymenoscyphus varicosporioides]
MAVIGYIAAILPLYVIVYLPLSHMLFGEQEKLPASQTPVLNSSFIASDEPLSCPSHKYNTFILSQEPLIVYIENFLSQEESTSLLTISEDKWTPSTVSTGAETSIQKDIRFSEVALIDQDDTVRCIEHRARDFQGWRPDLHIERLRTQRYGVGGHYRNHYDWSGASREADRVSTFMVYVDADCEGGGTEFPRIKMPDVRRGRWCEFLECSQDNPNPGKQHEDKWGVIFKPIKGNAVFWENLRPDGRGYEETFHAGLPVTSGTKVGLNIWSWGPARRK